VEAPSARVALVWATQAEPQTLTGASQTSPFPAMLPAERATDTTRVAHRDGGNVALLPVGRRCGSRI
jgi:hypothetical protein